MSAHRVLFKPDPSIVVAERTELGPAFDPRAPARQRDPLARFPFAAAVVAGIPWIRDIAGPDDEACLVQIEDDDTVVVDDPDA